MKNIFLKRFLYYKDLGEKTFETLTDTDIVWKLNSETNSIADFVINIFGKKHFEGMASFTIAEEKIGTDKELEFQTSISTKKEMLQIWEKGWNNLFKAFDQISEEDLQESQLIRDEKSSILEALLLQIENYSYHIGQVIYIAKMLKKEEAQISLMEKNNSAANTIAQLQDQNTAEIQENSSPVCFAKSEEVRDEYRLNE